MSEQSYINPHSPTTYSDLAREEAELERDKGRFAKPKGEQVPTSLSIPKQPPATWSNSALLVPDEPPLGEDNAGNGLTIGVDLSGEGGKGG